MGWFRDKAIRAEEAAKKAAQENLDAVEGMSDNEKTSLLWIIAVVAVVFIAIGAIFL